MSRLRIHLPEKFIFQTTLPVLIGHINYGNHLDNAAVIGLVSEARVRFFKHLGFQEGNVDGVGIVVADAAIQYKTEAFHGDTLVFRMTFANFTRIGCDNFYQIVNQDNGREVARGKSGIVFFDYQRRKTAPVPPGFKAALLGLDPSIDLSPDTNPLSSPPAEG
jgi:acyl-CoA thioester hydrolase